MKSGYFSANKVKACYRLEVIQALPLWQNFTDILKANHFKLFIKIITMVLVHFLNEEMKKNMIFLS
jgi:ABC-type enterochelin transport system permease subunit